MVSRHIVCFGNELHGDDGFGMHVYSQLSDLAWPADVEVFNAGIAGLNALRYLEDCSQAILVDALVNFGHVGEICLLKPEELAAKSPRQSTGHGLGIPYLLEALNIIRTPPEILIVGVEIAEIKPFCPGLSPEAERAVSETVRLIRVLIAA
jgi:hydrogenase 3 maturation protease